MLTPFTADQQQTLKAVLDRIIPADDFPGAWDAGVAIYIDRQLAGDLRHLSDSFLHGLAGIEGEAAARFAKRFTDLSPDDADRLLTAIEREEIQANWSTPPNEFFVLLTHLTMEGYYADPSNGGNINQISWKMIGYDPRGQVRSAR